MRTAYLLFPVLYTTLNPFNELLKNADLMPLRRLVFNSIITENFPH
jgi:hypothetical protein